MKRGFYKYTCLVVVLNICAGITFSNTIKSTYTVTESTAAVIKSTATRNVDIYADVMIYDHETETVFASGNVRVYYKDIELHADNLEYIKRMDFINAWGNVGFWNEGYTLSASTMNYYIKSSTGTVYNASIEASPLFVRAREVVIRSKDEFYVHSGDITTCDHDPPHYKFKGKKIKLKLDSRVSAYNTLLYIRGIPVFFYPYYSKKLGPRKLQIDLEFGTSVREGNFMKTKVSYPFTQNSRSYLGLDLMSKRGMGFKAGHGYSTDKGVSKIDTYYIREKETETNIITDKGRLYARGWQEIMKYTSIRYRTEYTSDYGFNYDYGQQVYEYKKRDLYYQMGLEYSKAKYIVSIYGNKKEEWDVESYKVTDFVVPAIKFKLFPIYIPGRIRFQGNTHYMNEYYPGTETSTEHWQASIMWETKIDKTYRLNVCRPYYITLVPGFGYDGVYRKNFSRFVSMFFSMRHGLYRMLFLDTDYVWRRSVEYPYAMADNRMNYRITYRPYSRFMVSSESSYDFREGINKPVGNFLTKLKYSYGGVGLYVRNRYEYYEKESREWLYELDIRRFSVTRVKYNYVYPRRLEISQTFNLKSRSFILSLGTRFYADKTAGFYKFTEYIEKSLAIQWDMHCWNSEFRLLTRGEETAFWVLFNVKVFPETKTGIYGNLLYDEYRFHRE